MTDPNRAELEAALREALNILHKPGPVDRRVLEARGKLGETLTLQKLAALASPPTVEHAAPQADVEQALFTGWRACRTQVFALNEDTAERYGKHFSESSNRGSFSRGRILEAKSIAKALDALGPENCDELAKARAAIAALSPSSSTEERERLKAAYIAGATAVHEHWLANPGEAPRGDPEFGEAAGDYAHDAIERGEAR